MTADIAPAAGQRHGADRTLRLRQEHAARRHRRLRRAGARPHPLAGPRPAAAGAGRAAGDAALPGAQPLRPPDRRAERRPRRCAPTCASTAPAGRASRRRSPRSGSTASARRRPAQLSGGQRQRVALARALLRARPLLLLDEPFAALGPAMRAEMLDLVARIRAEQDATLLFATHQPEDARRIAGQVVLVDGHRAHPPARPRPSSPTRRRSSGPISAVAISNRTKSKSRGVEGRERDVTEHQRALGPARRCRPPPSPAPTPRRSRWRCVAGEVDDVAALREVLHAGTARDEEEDVGVAAAGRDIAAGFENSIVVAALAAGRSLSRPAPPRSGNRRRYRRRAGRCRPGRPGCRRRPRPPARRRRRRPEGCRRPPRRRGRRHRVPREKVPSPLPPWSRSRPLPPSSKSSPSPPWRTSLPAPPSRTSAPPSP